MARDNLPGVPPQPRHVRVREHAIKDGTDIGHVARYRAVKTDGRILSRETHAPGDQFPPRIILRHRMSLQAMLHLQTVFKAAPELIRVGQLRVFEFGYQRSISQARETNQRMWRAQPGITASESKLKRLRDEFDFANPAAAELYVEAFVAALTLNVDLLLRQANVRQSRADAYVCAIDAINDRGSEAMKKRLGTGGGSRANQGLQLPIVGTFLVITDCFIQRARQRAFAAMRPHLTSVR